MTPTEKTAKILRLLADGLTIETVALMVGVSERFVKHIENVNNQNRNTMKTKHTPGEWVAKGGPYFRYVKKGEKGFLIAEVTTQSQIGVISDEESEANARLIAAAPELLAALEKFTMLNPEHYKDIAGFIVNAKEVVSKATNP